MFHNRSSAYSLFWPSSAEFVRLAAKFDSPVVTVAAVGGFESARVLLDSEEVRVNL